MKLPEWIVNLPRCPRCGERVYLTILHIAVIVDANGCIRLHYHAACEHTEPDMAEVY